MLDTLFPTLIERFGALEIQTALTEILRERKEESGIVVAVHPDMEAQLKHLMISAEHADGGGALPWSLQTDASLMPGACRVAWSQGGASLDLPGLAEKMRSDFLKLLETRNIKIEPDRDIGAKLQYDNGDDSQTSPNRNPEEPSGGE